MDLSESNEYGYCSLIKATKSVLDKLELENRTAATITSKERIDERFWNSIALRDAVINAIVHNDFTREVPPKFEIFSDRIDITSTGSLPEGMTENEFFEGFSIPRNKELMRIYKDLELVEQLGSGIPRILEHYDRGCFRFTENFLRMTFPAVGQVTPHVTPQVTPHVTPQVEHLLGIFNGEHTRQELQVLLGLSDRKNFRINYLNPAVEAEVVKLLNPDRPKSSRQRYALTEKGKNHLKGK